MVLECADSVCSLRFFRPRTGDGSGHDQDRCRFAPEQGCLCPGGRGAETGSSHGARGVNQSGGVLGKKVDLIIEDDTGEPSVGIAAAEKLLTRDKVVALIGGYSSTITFAQMNAIQRLEPFVAWVGASSTKVENEFGPKRWFFHYHPWDYHRQSTIRDFLLSISPRPKTVAVAYEDGIYGTTSRDYVVKYLKEKGLKSSSTKGSKAVPLTSPPCSPRSNGLIRRSSTGWPTQEIRP